VWPSGSWRTPLGELPVDVDLARRLLDRARPYLKADTFPHEQEHAVELQLPFLQFHRKKDLAVVPIVVGVQGRELAALGQAIADVVCELARRVLIVASSDMNHYESAAVAERKDRLALERVLALDPEGLLETCEAEDISMCGVRPT